MVQYEKRKLLVNLSWDKLAYSITGVMEKGVLGSIVAKKLLEADKLKHFFACLLIVLISSLWLPIFQAVILAITTGYLKELWDEQYGSGFCWYDMMANGIGTCVGLGFYFWLI